MNMMSIIPRLTALTCFILLILSNNSHADKSNIKPFTTDGCSRFPDGTLSQNDIWLECCVNHDKAYWKGGSYQERVGADNELRDCVKKAGEPAIAMIMLMGVRAGGTPYLPTDFRWGYGWPYLRGYKMQTLVEKEMIKKMNVAQ
jgi:hypothetical protein